MNNWGVLLIILYGMQVLLGPLFIGKQATYTVINWIFSVMYFAIILLALEVF